ncbi:MAG: hypothetical protein WCK28_11445, partial [Burkholderiales bacterium]
MKHSFRGRCAALLIACAAVAAMPGPARAGQPMGFALLAPVGDDEPVTVYYPTDDPVTPVRRGFATLDVAERGHPVRGNGRLVVVSHGTGGNDVPHAALAQALVDRGFVVAMPRHRGDNAFDHRPGSFDSSKRRPREISAAIDAVAGDPRFGPLLEPDRVGVYGFSAGGFAALVFAGGRWSPQRFLRHCDAHLVDDGCQPLRSNHGRDADRVVEVGVFERESHEQRGVVAGPKVARHFQQRERIGRGAGGHGNDEAVRRGPGGAAPQAGTITQ